MKIIVGVQRLDVKKITATIQKLQKPFTFSFEFIGAWIFPWILILQTHNGIGLAVACLQSNLRATSVSCLDPAYGQLSDSQRALAFSLLELPPAMADECDGATPPLAELLADARHTFPVAASRLPVH